MHTEEPVEAYHANAYHDGIPTGVFIHVPPVDETKDEAYDPLTENMYEGFLSRLGGFLVNASLGEKTVNLTKTLQTIGQTAMKLTIRIASIAARRYTGR